jgi:hypothetical protein
MIFEHYSKNKLALLVVFGGALVIGSVCIAWVNIVDKPKQAHCTQEAKICPDGSTVGRIEANCEFAPCPENNYLPTGYSLDSYTIEKTLNTACVKASDCQTPGEYLIRSNCPYTSLCLANKCTVVCPHFQ